MHCQSCMFGSFSIRGALRMMMISLSLFRQSKAGKLTHAAAAFA